MRVGAGHVIILTAVLVSVIGTFFVSNAITGFTTAREAVGKGDFAAVTGGVVSESQQPQQQLQLKGLRTAASSVVLGLLSIAALIVVVRAGQNAVANARESRTPRIPSMQNAVKRAENAVEEGNYEDAYALYNAIREQYAQLEEEGKQRHYSRIMQLHRKLAQQAATAEAHYLTEKYVDGTISEEEFQRLKQIIISQ